MWVGHVNLDHNSPMLGRPLKVSIKVTQEDVRSKVMFPRRRTFGFPVSFQMTCGATGPYNVHWESFRETIWNGVKGAAVLRFPRNVNQDRGRSVQVLRFDIRPLTSIGFSETKMKDTGNGPMIIWIFEVVKDRTKGWSPVCLRFSYVQVSPNISSWWKDPLPSS